jgi:antitoxin PrlF
LRIEKGDLLEYEIHGEEAVIRRGIAPSEEAGNDPVVGAFLEFLARDIATHPDRLTSLPPELLKEIERLTHSGGAVDHDEPLDGAVEL